MNQGFYDKKELSPTKTAYFFDGLSNYLKFTKETEPKLTGNARRGWDTYKDIKYLQNQAKSISWFGTKDVQSVIGEKTSFLFNDELNRFLSSIIKKTIKTDVLDLDQKKKLEFTEQELGIFSFDLASLGLVRVYEYYSPLLKTIVNSDYVRSITLGDGQVLFYHIKIEATPRHIVKYEFSKGGYYSNILKRVVAFEDLEEDLTDLTYYYPEVFEIPQHDVERIQKKNEDGSLKFATTFKKCFIHIPKPVTSFPRIDLIIAVGYDSMKNATNEMIWNSMAALAVAQRLSEANINYRIIATYGIQTSRPGTKKEAYSFVKIKDETTPLNPNMLATLLSDGRFYRYEKFLGNLTTMWDAGYDASIEPTEMGIPIYEEDKIKNTYIDYLKTNTGYSDRVASSNFDSKIFFNRALNEREAIQEYKRVIDLISNL